MHSVRLLHVYEILWACIWGYLTTSERLHIYRKNVCIFGALAHVFLWLVSLSNHKNCDSA